MKNKKIKMMSLVIMTMLVSFGLQANESLDEARTTLTAQGYVENSQANMSTRFDKCLEFKDGAYLEGVDLNQGAFFVLSDANGQTQKEHFITIQTVAHEGSFGYVWHSVETMSFTLEKRLRRDSQWECYIFEGSGSLGTGYSDRRREHVRAYYGYAGDLFSISYESANSSESSRFIEYVDAIGRVYKKTSFRDNLPFSEECIYYIGDGIISKYYDEYDVDCEAKWREENPIIMVEEPDMSIDIGADLELQCGEHAEPACLDNDELMCKGTCRVDYNWPNSDSYNCWCPPSHSSRN